MANFALIVAVDFVYISGLNALINSLHYCNNKHPLHVLAVDLPEAYMKMVAEKSDFPIIFHPFEEKEDFASTAHILLRKRFSLPKQLDYDSVCILDADMIVLQNINPYLEITAQTDFIFGCSKETKKVYNDSSHMFPQGKSFLIDPRKTNIKDITAVPLFIGRKWYDCLELIWTRFINYPYDKRWIANDMDGLNICLIESNAIDKLILLPQQTWTGLHETMLKAHSRAIDWFGDIYTEDHQAINIIHGKYWDQSWLDQQMSNQMQMIDREFEGCQSYKDKSLESLNLLKRWWDKMSVYKFIVE